MVRYRVLTLVVLLCLAGIVSSPAVSSSDPWQAVPGPYGASVAALAMSPNYAVDHTVFAGLRGGGVYRTTDFGGSWHPTGLADWPIIDLAISPTYASDGTLFATSGLWTSGYSVHRSADAGATWQDVTPAWSALPDPPLLAISPDFASDGTLYLLGGQQTYRSTDGGHTFSQLGGWFAVQDVAQIAFSPEFATDQTLFALEASAGLYKSTDGGTGWALTALQGTLTAVAVSPDYASDQMLLAVALEAGTGQLYESHNGGTSWSTGTLTLAPTGQHTLLFSPSFGPANPVIMAASSNDPCPYRSEDGGITWSPVGWYDPAHPYQGGFVGGSVFALALPPHDIWNPSGFAGTSAGIYRSSDQGIHWYQTNEGMPRLTVRALAAADPDTLLAGTSFFENLRADTSTPGEYNGNLQLSTDGGQSWRNVSGRLEQVHEVAFSPDFSTDQTAFSAAGTLGQHGYYDGGVYRSTDGAENWEEVLADQICTALAISPDYVSDQTLWVSSATDSSSLGISVSNDGGDTWTSLAPAIAASAFAPSPNYAVDGTLFAGTPGIGLQRSTDSGSTWTQVMTQSTTALAVSPAYGASQTVYAGGSVGPGTPGAIYRSTDGGDTWQELNTGIPATWDGEALTIAQLGFAYDGSVLAAVYYGNAVGGGAVYRSGDGGQTWQAVGTGLDAHSVFALASVPGGSLTFYAGTDGGLWQLDVPQGGPAEPGTWVTSGPRGGRAHALSVSPSFPSDGVAFTGEHILHRFGTESGLGIFRSTDWGQNWAPSGSGTEDMPNSSALHDFAFSPDFDIDGTVFAATWGGLYRSTDGGDNWLWLSRLFFGPPGSITAVAVAPDYATSGHVLAASGWSGLYASRDGGINWTSYLTVPATSDVAFSPDYPADGVALAAGSGLHRSGDYGHSWTEVLTESITSIAFSPQFGTDGTVFASSGCVYISYDGGLNWITVTPASGIGPLAISPDYGTDQSLFGGSGDGVYRSTDGGLTWELMAGSPGTSIHSLAISPGWPGHPVLLAGTEYGVYWTHDGGASWTLAPGMAALPTGALALSADNRLLMASAERHGLYGSPNQGGSWMPMGLNAMTWNKATDIEISPAYAVDGSLFASMLNLESIGAGVHRTTDGGATWEQVYGTSYIGGMAISPHYESDQVVFATAEASYILRSEDGGDTWSEVGEFPPLTDGAALVALPPDYPADSTLFAAGPDGFWRLPPGETSWQPAASGLLSDTYVLSLDVSPHYSGDATLLAVASWSEELAGRQYYGVFRSSDGGVNWDLVNAGLPDIVLRQVAFSPTYAVDSTAYVAAEDGLYRSLDGGLSWTGIGKPPGVSSLQGAVVDNLGRVHVSTDLGVWRYTTPAYDIVINGGFEADSGWEMPVTIWPASYVDGMGYDGRRAALVGMDNGACAEASYSSARQVVAIPTGVVSATLRGYAYAISGEASRASLDRAFPLGIVPGDMTADSAADGDAQYLLILEPDSSTILETLFWQLSNSQSWQPFTFDLTSYAGQTISLHFGAYNDASGGQTGMYVDNVSLLIQHPSAPQILYMPIMPRQP